MTLSKDRVIAEGVSAHTHEQEAIAFLKSALPDHDSILFWGLVEMVDTTGRRYELDALVTGPHALYLVEIKSWPGEVSGDVIDWKIRYPDGHLSVVENPLGLAARKARVLGSLLEKRMRGPRPWVEPLIFLGHEAVKNKLAETARSNVVARDRVVAAIVQGKVPGSDARLQGRPFITRQQRTELISALKAIGIAGSKGAMRLGDYRLGEMLAEGPGYQDREAVNELMPQMKARVRTYLVPQSPTLERREQLTRAATREARVLTLLGDNPNILRVQGYQNEGPTGGPCITFERFEESLPLDVFLRASPALSFDLRVSIIEQIATALEFCHRKQVLHRGLHPGAVLVRKTETGVHIKLTNFASASQLDGSQGTVHISALSAEPANVYRAPEVIEDPSRAAAVSDVFSLGAIAYHVLSGKPPGASLPEREKLLKAGGGQLSLKAASDENASLDEVVGFAADANSVTRANSAAEWLQLFLDRCTAPEPRKDKDPLEARTGDELPPDLRVLDVLGAGSSAKVLQVARGNIEYALKVPSSPEAQDRLEVEAATLERLQKCERVVSLHARLQIAGRSCLLLDYAGRTLAAELMQDGPVSVDYASRWGEDLLQALQFMEDKDIQHRDIKPANLGVIEGSKTKKARHLLLFDFSLAGPIGSLEVGTAAYRDPFLFDRGVWDAAADRWSAAITLYEMLTAVRPRFGEAAATAVQDEITLEPDRFDASVRDRLTRFFRKALRREASERHASAEEMRREWLSCFVSYQEQDSGPPPIALSSVNAGTPVEALPLGLRARNALDRAGVMNARQLVQLPANQLSSMRGVGRMVAKEIVQLIQKLRDLGVAGGPQPFWVGACPPELVERVPGVPPEAAARLEDAGLARVHEVAAADKELVDRQLQPFAGAREALIAWLEQTARQEARAGTPTTIEAWIEALLKKDKDLRLLFGVESKDGQWLTDVRSLSRAVEKTPQAIYLALSRARGAWAEHKRIDQLIQATDAALIKAGEVAPLPRAGKELPLLLPHDPEVNPEQAARNEQALLRIACELAHAEDEDTGPAFVRLGEAGWIGLTRGHVHAARRLGGAADDLAVRATLPSFQECRDALQAAAAGTPLAALQGEMLVTLAAEASRNAAVSARLEIYPRGLAAARALSLSQGALSGALSIEAVQAAVRSRYPEAEPLPARPALDALLEPMGLRWNDETSRYERPGATPASSSATIQPLPRLPTAHSDRPARALTTEELDASDFDESLRRDSRRGLFRVLDVIAPRADEAAQRIAERLGAEALPLDKALIDAALELALTLKIDEQVIYRADRAGPRSDEWKNLSQLMTRAAEKVLADLRGHPRELVVTRPGLLARFQLDKFLRALIELAERDDAPAVFFVNPVNDAPGDQHPVRGSLQPLPIPVTSPGQHIRVPDAWLENRYRGRS